MKKINFVLLIITLFSAKAFAQPAGTLDNTFGGTGKVTIDFGNHDNANCVKIQPDQNIVTVGVALNASYSGELKVTRNLPNGTFDNTFGVSGIVSIPLNLEAYGYDCYIMNDGHILVSGITSTTPGYFDMYVLKMKSDGSLDSSFGLGGIAQFNKSAGDDIASAMAVQADGKIVLSGTVQDSSYRNVPSVVRFTANGVIDSTFGTNGLAQIPIIETDNELTSISVQPDGKIVAAGHYSVTLFDFDLLLARFNSNGTLDASFGSSGIIIKPISASDNDDCFGMELTSTGKILLAGFTTGAGYNLNAILIQFDSTGTLDPTFGTGGGVSFNLAPYDVANDLKIQTDNKIIIVGGTGVVGSNTDFLIVRYNSNGTIDPTFNTTGYVTTDFGSSFDEANSVAIQADGKIVVAGKANTGATNDFGIARYNVGSLEGVKNISESNTLSVYPNPVSENGQLFLDFNLKDSGETQVQLYNTLGSAVFSVNLGNLSKGNNQTEINIPDTISQGIYFVQVKTKNSLSATFKLIVTK